MNILVLLVLALGFYISYSRAKSFGSKVFTNSYLAGFSLVLTGAILKVLFLPYSNLALLAGALVVIITPLAYIVKTGWSASRFNDVVPLIFPGIAVLLYIFRQI